MVVRGVAAVRRVCRRRETDFIAALTTLQSGGEEEETPLDS